MQLSKTLLLALLASAGGIASNAMAQKPELSTLSISKLNAQIVDARKQIKGDPRAFCVVEPLLRELDRREPNTLTRAEAEYDAAICSIAGNDILAMWRHTRAAEDLLPLQGGGNLRIAVEALALDIAAGTHDADRYTAHVIHVAKMDDPGAFAIVDGEKIFANLSQMPQAFGDSAYLAFAETSNFSQLPRYFRQAIGEFAVLPALRAGKRDVALRMIDQVSDVDHVYPLLLDRRYATLWPEIDRRVGLHQGLVAGDFVTFSKEEWAAEPNNRWAFGDLVRSLVVAGRNREAIVAYQLMPKDPDSIAHYQAGDAWAINAAVVALDREGRRDEADQAFDSLTQVSVETNPWMLSLLNNRTGRLIDQGRWANAMVAARDSLTAAERYGSIHYQASAAANIICVAAHVPSDPAVERANAILVLNGDKEPVASAFAALCRGDKTKAKAMILAGLRNEDSRWLMVLNAQAARASPLPIAYKSTAVDLGEFVRSDTELTAEFNRYGRFLPDDLQLKVSTEGK
jgi:hypothetical protein